MRGHLSGGVALQRPIVERDIHVGIGSFRQSESLPCRALIVEQMPDIRIGECCMCKQTLLGRKGAVIALIDGRTCTEECHLKAQRTPLRRIEPARDVPPLVSELGMGAMIAREAERYA